MNGLGAVPWYQSSKNELRWITYRWATPWQTVLATVAVLGEKNTGKRKLEQQWKLNDGLDSFVELVTRNNKAVITESGKKPTKSKSEENSDDGQATRSLKIEAEVMGKKA